MKTKELYKLSYNEKKYYIEKDKYLNIFIDDKDWSVRCTVAQQGYGLDKLFNDKNNDVRLTVQEYLDNQEYISIENWVAKNTDKCTLNDNGAELSYEERILKIASALICKSHNYIENEKLFNLIGYEAYLNLKDGFIINRIKENWYYITDAQLDNDLLYEILDQVNEEFLLGDKDKAAIADNIVNSIAYTDNPREALEMLKAEDNYELEM